MTTLRSLIEALEDYAASHGDDCEVRLMHQPAWPFEYSINGIVASDEIVDHEEDDDSGYKPQEADGDVIYLTEGRQIGYGCKAAWDNAQRIG